AGGVAVVDPVISFGIVMFVAPGMVGAGGVAPGFDSRGTPSPSAGGTGASAAGAAFVAPPLAGPSDRRSGAGGTRVGAGTKELGTGPIEGAAAGGFSRGLLVSIGACRAPR